MSHYIRVRHEQPHARVEGRHRCTLGRPLEPSNPGGEPQGIFAGWDWDGRRLEVRNDRYGLYPLFYYQNEHEIVVSDSLTRVVEIADCRELDFDALAVFLRCHLYLGEDTAFRQVRQVPPGATLVWTGGRFTLEGRRPAPRAVTLNRDEDVGAYVDLFRESVRRRLPADDNQEIVVPLSGGQDSRHILLELLAQGRPPGRCVTVSRAWSPKLMVDLRLATEVANAAGIPHTVLMQDDPLFESESRKNPLTNFCTAEHAWFLSLIDHGGLEGTLVLDGLAGDILSACAMYETDIAGWYREGQFTRIAELVLGPEDAHRDVLESSFYAQVGRDRAVRRLTAEVERHANAVNPLIEFIFWNRTRRAIGTAPYSILSSVATVDTPYLDCDLFDFLIARPPESLDPEFHQRTIRAAYPRFAGIPFSELSFPLTDRARPFVRYARQVSRSFLRSSLGRPTMFRKGYVVPRLSRCLVDPRYAIATAWLPQLVIYLSQLGALARPDGGSRPRAGRLVGPGVSEA